MTDVSRLLTCNVVGVRVTRQQGVEGVVNAQAVVERRRQSIATVGPTFAAAKTAGGMAEIRIISTLSHVSAPVVAQSFPQRHNSGIGGCQQGMHEYNYAVHLLAHCSINQPREDTHKPSCGMECAYDHHLRFLLPYIVCLAAIDALHSSA